MLSSRPDMWVAVLLASAGVEAFTWLIELGVGVACLVAGASAIRGGRLPVTGALLVVAGLAASGHATFQLLGFQLLRFGSSAANPA